jgi:plastocyanin
MKMKVFNMALLTMVISFMSIVNSQVVHTIVVSDFEFTPNDLTVMVGDTVRWSYTSGVHPHNVKADNGSFTSGTPALPTWIYNHVFTSAGNNPYYCEPHGGPGGAGMSGVVIVENPVGVDDEKLIADKFELLQNYPNPFNPSTNIGFRISDRGFVSLKVYNILGDEIATLINEEKEQGVYDVTFNAAGLSSGMYLYKLSVVPMAQRDLVLKDGQAGAFVETKKMIIIK